MSCARLIGSAAAVMVVAVVAWMPAFGQKDGKAPPAKAAAKSFGATPVERLKVKKDFKVELLYSVPQGQGSWVAMTVDPKGRLITSDQYGKLYRVTPPQGDQPIQVETIPADIGAAQGLVWAFDALYAVVQRGKDTSGLYRVTSSKNDDVLDKVELLRNISPGGEHGPHGIVLSPDGKSLVLVAGNHSKMTKMDRSTVPQIWGEDFILPRQWDASGHAAGILAPGGWIARTDKDGKTWELVSMGYRNQYDLAYNRDGELFTYDSDMEWDMNTPWYRPTRVCHAIDGSEFGWRSGTGVYPDHYIDNLPPVVNVGQGSPTGVAFGYGAKFPAKYQDALFLCDWSYGKLYALHLKEDGSSYKGDLEEFITGTPLPLTDIVVNPKDGALYFTIGGRRVTSGLYRVRYVGNESTTPVEATLKDKKTNAAGFARDLRHQLESYYFKKGPEGIALAWKELGNKDRFIRWAARTVLEHNGPGEWQDKAFTLTDPQAAQEAMLALIRVGDKSLQSKILERLDTFDLAKLDPELKLGLVRLYQLAFVRMGAPNDAARLRTIARIDPSYPSNNRELNAELCKLLVYLEAPSAASKTLALMNKAPSQEEQMEYALSLRNLKTGWTPEQRQNYFGWFAKAQSYRGGHSFLGFVRNIKNEAVAKLTPEEKAALKPLLEAKVQVDTPWTNAKPRPFVKQYTVEELIPIVEKGLVKRDFDRGHKLFGEAKCFACHRFAQEGGAFGPDLTALAGRFNVKDLLESIIEPSKTIADQYAAITVATQDGKVVTGRIINLNADQIMINTDMLNPDKLTGINRKNIESIETSKISMMPTGLIDNLTQDEVLDLVGYLLSRGDRSHAMYAK